MLAHRARSEENAYDDYTDASTGKAGCARMTGGAASLAADRIKLGPQLRSGPSNDRLRHVLLRLFAVCSIVGLLACASAPRAPAVAHEEEADAAVSEEAPPPVETAILDAPERSRPPSTASYAEAMSTPEALDVHDDHAHLSDGQLTGPMGGVTRGCRLPSNAKVTIKTAVQYGRAIGVTVDVRLIKPKSARRRSKAAARAEAKALAKIAACIDRNVRAVVWPPSRRRDSFTMDL